MVKKFFFVAALFFAVLGMSSSAQAIEYGSLGGKPAYPKQGVPHGETWFMYNLGPGESLEDAIEVSNLYAEPLEALIYAADTTRSSGGGFALEQFSEPKDEVGSWVRFYPNEPPAPFSGLLEEKRGGILELCQISRDDAGDKLDKREILDEEWEAFRLWCGGEEHVQRKMEAKERIVIPFIIKIPDSVDVGEHTGGILVQKVNPETQKSASGSSIKLTTRVGVRIYETVPGEVVKKLTLEDFKVIKNFSEFSFDDFGENKKPQEYLIQTRIASDGNVSTEYEDTIRVKDLLFKKRNEEIGRKFQVLKKDKFVSNYAWQNPRFGRFSFQSESKYIDSQGQEQVIFSPEIKLLIMPWREMAIALVLLLIGCAAYWIWKWRQRKKYGGVGWENYTVTEGESLLKMAEKFQIDWKVLARTNGIKAPYTLETGQVIKVPPGFGVPAGEKDAGEAEDNARTLKQKMESAFSRVSPFLKYWPYAVLILIILALSAKLFFLCEERTKLIRELANVQTDLEAEKKAAVQAKQALEEEKGKSDKKTEAAETAVNPAEVNVTVLNGGAAAGSAGKIREFLVEEGYEKAGAENAEGENYIGAVVYYRESFEKSAEDLAEIIKEKYSDVSTKLASSEEERQSDLVVILGK